MTKEDILDILNQARDYADRSVQECKDAQELISGSWDTINRSISFSRESYWYVRGVRQWKLINII